MNILKKMLQISTVSIGLLLAGQAFAMAYAPGTQITAGSGASGNMMLQTTPESGSQTKMYVQGMQQGTLTPEQQMEFSKIMQGQNSILMPGNMSYRVLQSFAPAPFSGSRQAAWLGLMFVMTVILVWANLLLLIAFLWHQVKKHKHN